MPLVIRRGVEAESVKKLKEEVERRTIIRWDEEANSGIRKIRTNSLERKVVSGIQ